MHEALWGLNMSGLGVSKQIDTTVSEMISRKRTFDVSIIDEIFDDFREVVRRDYPSHSEIDAVINYLPDIEFLYKNMQATAERIMTAKRVRGLNGNYKRYLGLVGLKLQSYLLEIQAHIEWVVYRA